MAKKKRSKKKKPSSAEKRVQPVSNRKSSWGYPVFILAAVIAGLAVEISVTYPQSRFPFLYQNVFVTGGIILSLVAVLTGHLSYSRVNSLRVYMAGYLTGMICLCFFLLSENSFIDFPRPAPPGYFPVICILALINFFLIPLLPGSVKYRFARSSTLAVLAIEVVVLLTLRFAPGARGWTSVLTFSGKEDSGFWFGPLLFLGSTVLSFLRLRDEFSLGGLIAGCSLIFALIWTFGIDAGREISSQIALFSTAPLFLVAGTLVHWFSRIENRVSYDPLLQIYNRDYCTRIITEQANMKTTPPFSVAMVDIDHFKNVNDTYGHQAGDAVLHTVAQTLLKGLSPQGVVCRYGGEELAIFFPQKTTEEVVPLMEQARMDIEKTKTASGKKKISVTISCGVSHREAVSQSVMEVIHAADKALYKAKNEGRNQVKSAKV
ncbi:MAG: GGDEF domain-containing protein [Fibrobacter sp.]|nr:GGDEF domain-containing protein [Fibrobacter sp.]